MTDVIVTRGLVKRFGRVTAVAGVDLRIPAGIRFGLLGPNGSGKTTLVRMLLGLVHATAGEVELLGEPMPRHAARVLPRVGALVEGPAAWANCPGAPTCGSSTPPARAGGGTGGSASAIVAGDAVAGEASAGTLRYLLVRPVSRLRLLVAKLVSITVFVLLAVLFVTVTGYLVGVALFGFGPDAELGGAGGVTSLSGAVLSPAELLARTALVVGYLALCMLALGAVGLFFSTLTDSPLAAALGVLALVVASAALQPLDAAAALEPYLPTAHWLAWIDLYRDPILWPAVREGAAVQAGYVLVAFGAAWANFATKDVTS